MTERQAVERFEARREQAEALPPIPSMLKADERVLYAEVARRHYAGDGAVVEIGTWLGSGTHAICEGLAATGRPWRLVAIDRFRWNEVHATKKGGDDEGGEALAAGESFLDAFLGNLGAFRDRVQAIPGEVNRIEELLPDPGPIELLYIDAPKSWRLLRRVLAHLGPHLRPGARVVLQDFFHLTSRQLIWLMLSLPEARLVATTREGTTAVFEAEGPLASLAAGVPERARDLGRDGLLAMWARARETLPDERLGLVAAGLALDLLAARAPREAEAVLREAVVGGPGRADVLAHVRRQAGRNEDLAPALRAILAFVEQGRPLDAERAARA